MVSRARAAARQVLAIKDEITSLTDVYTGLNVATDLSADHLTGGDHAGLDLAEVKAAFLALGAINTSIKAGTPSNMTKIIKIT